MATRAADGWLDTTLPVLEAIVVAVREQINPADDETIRVQCTTGGQLVVSRMGGGRLHPVDVSEAVTS